MPGKIQNDDWERLFGPNAPRRGGPLQVLGTIIVVAVVIGVLGAGMVFLLRYRDQQQAVAQARATVVAATVYPLATATMLARTQTAAAAQTAAAQPTAVAGIGVGVVTNGGNLRREPVLEESNIIGLIWPGDEIAFLEQRDVAGQTWFRVQVLRPAAQRGGEGVAAGSEGWASSTLLSDPQSN